MHIKVKVRTAAKKEVVTRLSENSFAISVKQKPLENRANRRVVELIASHFHVPVKKVRIVSGHHSPSKMLLIS